MVVALKEIKIRCAACAVPAVHAVCAIHAVHAACMYFLRWCATLRFALSHAPG